MERTETDIARRREVRAESLLMVVVLIWASNYPVAKWGIAGLGVWVFNAMRFLVAAAGVALYFQLRCTWVPVARNDWAGLMKASLVAGVVYQVAFILGLSMTTAGNSAVLMATSPLWTVLFEARLHRRTIPASMVAGMLVSLAGVVMIIIGSGKKMEFGSAALAGDLISLAAAALWALNTNLQKPIVARYPAPQVSLIMLTVGAIGLSLIAIPAALTLSWSGAGGSHYAAALISGTLSIGASNVIWTYGVKFLGPGRTAVFSNLIPVLAFVISYFALDEQVLPIHFVGAAVTVAGVWYARR